MDNISCKLHKLQMLLWWSAATQAQVRGPAYTMEGSGCSSNAAVDPCHKGGLYQPA
jgi:hypothetical protein